MVLWTAWMDAVCQFRLAFSRDVTFLWFVTTLIAVTIRTDMAGVTSLVRSLGLKPCCYFSYRRLFHSSAVKLDALRKIWCRMASNIFRDRCVRISGKIVFLCDGIKTPKEGRKMPAVKSLHQESNNNSKPEFIMGHSWQAVALLVKAAASFCAVPVAACIGEGIIRTNRDKRTQLDHLIALMDSLAVGNPYYLLADAYYACRKIARFMVKNGCHLISRVRINAVAYLPPENPPVKRKRGRPKRYGKKVRLRTLFNDQKSMSVIDSPYKGDGKIQLMYRSADLLWRPLGLVVRYVAVIHPRLGRRIFLSTDTALTPVEIILAYSWRYKIEVMFRQAVHVMGAYAYRFWMQMMTRIKKGDGNQYLHRKNRKYREQVGIKLGAYNLHVQITMIAQGLLIYISSLSTAAVWDNFRGWLRTIRPGRPPSEWVVAHTLRDCFPEFLDDCPKSLFLKKFLSNKIDPGQVPRLLGAK